MKTLPLPDSKTIRGIIIGLGIAAAALFIFVAGVQVGYHQARFEHNYGDNYNRMFIGPHRTDQGPGFGSSFPGSPGGVNDHGAVGEVVSVNGSQFVVAGLDKVEKTIIVNSHTIVRQYRSTASASNIHVGSFVVVIGSPTATGDISADVVRLIPPPPGFAATTPAANSTSSTTAVTP